MLNVKFEELNNVVSCLEEEESQQPQQLSQGEKTDEKMMHA